MAKRIDGKAIATQIKQELKEQVQQLAKDNITVTLAVRSVRTPHRVSMSETNSEPVRSLESTAFPMNWKKRRRRRNCFP